jgi:hypothetical protein
MKVIARQKNWSESQTLSSPYIGIVPNTQRPVFSKNYLSYLLSHYSCPVFAISVLSSMSLSCPHSPCLVLNVSVLSSLSLSCPHCPCPVNELTVPVLWMITVLVHPLPCLVSIFLYFPHCSSPSLTVPVLPTLFLSFPHCPCPSLTVPALSSLSLPLSSLSLSCSYCTFLFLISFRCPHCPVLSHCPLGYDYDVLENDRDLRVYGCKK